MFPACLSTTSPPPSRVVASRSACVRIPAPGYGKTQWPETSQGATGQSIGGLYCNADGFLELTRPSHTKLCEQGAPGVSIQNTLGGIVSLCQTDYPSSESMVLGTLLQPGQTSPMMNPIASQSYQWQGKTTTAQYYINKLGLGLAEACVWTSSVDPSGAGNWAPTNFGVGTDDSGTTYLSIFANQPTSSATLDYTVEIKGDITAECALRNGQYTGGGNGCTVSRHMFDAEEGNLAKNLTDRS